MKEINVISFDVPLPANYGGVIDVFYKIKEFHKHGIKVHLHTFEYDRGVQEELEEYCASVHYYKRKTGIFSFLSRKPYIVKSRTSRILKKNLLKNKFPILFEGLHSCHLLKDRAFKKRYKIFRATNIEHNYYQGLAEVEQNALKKKYYLTEAKRLRKFEPIVKHADLGLIVSLSELSYFEQKYSNNKFVFVPNFHPSNEIRIKEGTGKYVLYHGNMSVAENINAAIYIIKELFTRIETPLVIAGLNPPKEIVHLVNQYPHISLVENPEDDELKTLISNAQINLLYTDQATGMKLKLLNVLFNGRHCVVNDKMVEGTTLDTSCNIGSNSTELLNLISSLFYKEVSESEIENRKEVLKYQYTNESSYQKLMDALPTYIKQTSEDKSTKSSSIKIS